MLSSSSPLEPAAPLRRAAMKEAATMSLDDAALARLRELDPTGKNRLIARVLAAFETSALRLAEQMTAARSRGDVAGVRHVVHTLKSSSASIGALELARICAEIEVSLRSESLDGLLLRLDSVDRELNAVLQAVRSLLEATPSPPP